MLMPQWFIVLYGKYIQRISFASRQGKRYNECWRCNMINITKNDIEQALQIYISSIRRCENIQPKFPKGSAQYTLLHNRIQALYIVKLLLEGEDISLLYADEEIQKAVPPILSILHKCRKAQEKYEIDTKQYQRFQGMIQAMRIGDVYLKIELAERNITL